MFVNYSNHPIEYWSDAQREAAVREFGNEMVDVTFVPVPSEIDETEIKKMADQEVGRIVSFAPQAVMCQGEFTLTYAIVEQLKNRGIKCVAACSERDVEEYTDEKGNRKKEVKYEFVRFREYT